MAAETEAFASPTPKPCNTAWVAREPERLEAKAWREKKRSEGLSREQGSLLYYTSSHRWCVTRKTVRTLRCTPAFHEQMQTAGACSPGSQL